jgi:hypothetical protein
MSSMMNLSIVPESEQLSPKLGRNSSVLSSYSISQQQEDVETILARAAGNIPSLNLSPTIARRNSLSPPSLPKFDGPTLQYKSNGLPVLYTPPPMTIGNSVVSSGGSNSSLNNMAKEAVTKRMSSMKLKFFGRNKSEGSREALLQ